jgi:LEA14-like dessication related protein
MTLSKNKKRLIRFSTVRGILFIIPLLTFMSCAPFKEPVFKSYDGMEGLKMDGKNINFTLKGTIENPNWYALKVKPSMVEVMVDGKKFANVYLDKKVKIKAKKSTALVAPMHAELEDGAMMRMMGMALKDSVRLNLAGDVKGGVFFIYKKFPVNITRSVSPKGLNPMKSMNPFKRD